MSPGPLAAWICLAGGAPVALIARALGGARYREVGACSLVLHGLALLWSLIATSAIEDLPAGGFATALVAVPVAGWFAATIVLALRRDWLARVAAGRPQRWWDALERLLPPGGRG